MYNLFDNWNSPCYVVTRAYEKIPDGPVLKATKLPFIFENYRSYGNRWLKRLNPAITRANLNRQQKITALPPGWPQPKQAWVLISTTEPIKLHFAWLLQHRFGYTVIPYFMDDWMAGLRLGWKDGDIQQLTANLLNAAPCWLMISRQLEEILRKRYELEKKPCLVVQNPAPFPFLSPQRGEGIDSSHLPALTPASMKHSGAGAQAGMTTDSETSYVYQSSATPERDSTNRQLSPIGGAGGGLIIYAGSIWPMHADALIASVKAIHFLNETNLPQGKGGRRWTVDGVRPVVPNLTIYTSEAHWKKYQSQLEVPGVTYGGWKPYNEIHKALQDAWLLLCTASFEEQHKAFSNSSVQTKLTDYMAVGKPVLFVGPADAASGVFVEEHEIGFTIETSQPADIAARLEAISWMPAAWERKAGNARELAATTFSKPVVQQQLYDFLAQYALPSPESLLRPGGRWPKTGLIIT